MTNYGPETLGEWSAGPVRTLGTGLTLNSGTISSFGAALGSLFIPVTIPRANAANLAWINQNGSSYTQNVNGPLNITFNTFTAALNGTMLSEAPPGSAPWTATQLAAIGPTNLQNYIAFGLGILNSSNAYMTIGALWGANILSIFTASNINSNASVSSPASFIAALGNQLWSRIYNDGTNYNFQWSTNGAQWHTLYQEAVATFGAATQVGPMAVLDNNNVAGLILSVDILGLEIVTGTGTNTTWLAN